jgi:hypothetical protein
MMPDLVLLAAGLGARYGGQKQLAPVGPEGQTLMDYAIFDACRAGVGRLVFVIGRELEAELRATVGRRYGQAVEVVYAVQELADLPAGYRIPAERRKPWGTAQAVLAARDHLGGHFIVCNADDFYGAASFRHLVRFLRRPAGPAACHGLVAYRLDQTLSAHGGVSRALCGSDAHGRLVRIEEHPGIRRTPAGLLYDAPGGAQRPLSGAERVSMNLWGFRAGILPQLAAGFRDFLDRHGEDPQAEYYLPAAVGELVDQGQACVQVLDTAEPWFGLTYAADRPEVAARLAEHVARGDYPRRLWA